MTFKDLVGHFNS